MKNPSSVSSKEFGLAAGIILFRFFLNTDHLHFGYWPEDLPVNISNLKEAQDNYCDVLISSIPGSARSILDVGCGTGAISRQLIEKGYEVESVSPSPFLTSQAAVNLDGVGHIHESTFEDLELDRKFDIILFAESLQYIELKGLFDKCRNILNEGGHILVYDFFKRSDAAPEIRIGGGHRLENFYTSLEEGGFMAFQDTDLTPQMAPTMDVAADMINNLAKPLWDLILYGLESNYPRLKRFVFWRYRKKIEKIDRMYFADLLTAENFSAVKSYRLVLIQPK